MPQECNNETLSMVAFYSTTPCFFTIAFSNAIKTFFNNRLKPKTIMHYLTPPNVFDISGSSQHLKFLFKE